MGLQRLPDAARQVGKAMGELRRLSTGFQNELKGALDDTGPAPRSTARDPLGAPVAAASDDDPVRASLDSVSGQPALPADPKVGRAPRREPLKAAPGKRSATKPSAKPATKRTAKRATPSGSTGAAKRSSAPAAAPARRSRTSR